MLIHAEEVCDKDKWISATSPYMNLLRHFIVIFQKCVTVLFDITLGMCIKLNSYCYFFLNANSGSISDVNIQTEQRDNSHLGKGISTQDSNLQLSRRWYLLSRGPGTGNPGIIPDPMLSSLHLSEPSWECKTSLLHNPHAAIFFCQCWKL